MRAFREIHQRLESIALDIEDYGWATSSDIANLIVTTEELGMAIDDAEKRLGRRSEDSSQ